VAGLREFGFVRRMFGFVWTEFGIFRTVWLC